MNETLYILVNESYPGLVKIGQTGRDADERTQELSSNTAVPTRFTIYRQYPVPDAAAAERKIHQRLAEYRVAANREFFRLPAEDAAMILDQELSTTATPRMSADREDELLQAATQLAIELPFIGPAALTTPLQISHEEAERLILCLRGRGIINDTNELNIELRAERAKRLLEARMQATLKRVEAMLAALDTAYGSQIAVRFLVEHNKPTLVIRGADVLTAELERHFTNNPGDATRLYMDIHDLSSGLAKTNAALQLKRASLGRSEPGRYTFEVTVTDLLDRESTKVATVTL